MSEQKKRLYTLYGLTVLTVISAIVFGWTSFRNAKEPNYWVDANEYLSSISTENTVVLSFWDNGWWIKDQASTKVFVHNGGHSKERDQIVAEVYCAACDSCAWQKAIANGIDYVIFSTRESNVYPSIKRDCGYQGLKEHTLWYRARQDNFSSNYFNAVYQNSTKIVILEVVADE